jgi:mono/diheme cytochrome c family protein
MLLCVSPVPPWKTDSRFSCGSAISVTPAGEAGLGPAINNKPLPGFLIRFQVRRGIGAMPAFSPDEISPQELENLVLFLKELRHHSENSS